MRNGKLFLSNSFVTQNSPNDPCRCYGVKPQVNGDVTVVSVSGLFLNNPISVSLSISSTLLLSVILSGSIISLATLIPLTISIGKLQI